MTTIGKLWTASIAYVALAVGAGLSIMYNVVDTMAVRGAALDIYDVVTAVAAPAIVVLMVELFVSNWWVGTKWPMQMLRWAGCLVIGGVAMRASWTHGHDFMLRRGQAADVAIAWPLAIDLLAVMATALILAGRRVRLSAVTKVSGLALSAADVRIPDEDMSAMARKLSALPDTVTVSGLFDSAGMSAWGDGPDRALTDMGEQLAREAQDYAWNVAADTQPLPRRTRTQAGHSCPQEFADMATAWDPHALERADMVKLSAAYFDVSTRTARRWLAAVLNEPVSGAGGE